MFRIFIVLISFGILLVIIVICLLLLWFKLFKGRGRSEVPTAASVNTHQSEETVSHSNSTIELHSAQTSPSVFAVITPDLPAAQDEECYV